MCTYFDVTYMYKRIVTVKVKEQDMDESRSSMSFGDSQTSQTRMASKWMRASLRLLGLMKSSYIYMCCIHHSSWTKCQIHPSLL